MDRYGNQNNGNPRWHREEQSEEQNTQFGIQNPSNFETNSIGGLQYPHDQGLTPLSQGHIQLFGNPGHQTPVSSAHHDPLTHMQATSSNLPIHQSNQTTMNTSWPSSQGFFHNQTFTGQARTQNNHQANPLCPYCTDHFTTRPLAANPIITIAIQNWTASLMLNSKLQVCLLLESTRAILPNLKKNPNASTLIRVPVGHFAISCHTKEFSSKPFT